MHCTVNNPLTFLPLGSKKLLLMVNRTIFGSQCKMSLHMMNSFRLTKVAKDWLGIG